MFRTVQGIYRNGEVALREAPDDVQDGTPVLVTFLAAAPIDLADHGIGPPVVEADNLNTGLSQHIVAMITSRLFRAAHPSRVTILRSSPAGLQSGLLTDSVVMTDNLATIAYAALDRVIGTLPMAEVERASRHTLGL